MNKYQICKKQIEESCLEFHRTDNLLALKKMIEVGYQIFLDNDCVELLANLPSKMPPERV